MKKIDYYAVQQPWKMPKWLGLTLGGVFGVITLGSAVAAYELMKPPPKAQEVAAVAAPAEPASAVATPPVTVTAKAPVAAEAPAPVAHHSSKHAKAAKHGKAMAKRMSPVKSAAILAKHDSKEKRHQKDALDKLLGL